MQKVNRTAIVYHFFAHYREAVLRELLNNSHNHYELIADTTDPYGGIKPCDVQTFDPNFTHAPCRLLHKEWLWQSGLIRLSLRSDIDTIIYLASPYFLSTWVSALVARIMKKRVLFWMHGWTKRETGFKAALRRTFYRLADGFLLYGHHAKCIGIEEGFKPEKMYVIYNSLDYTAQIRARNKVTEEQISHLRSELFAQPDCPMLICTSRLTKVRRLDLLLNAMKILQEEGLATNLLLVGDGPEKEALQRLSSELGVSVHFFGECYDEDKIAELTMAAAITVAPGKVGLTAMHSLAYGTPVITHDDFEDQMPEWEAIIPGKSGGFFRRDDVADLARAIENWLRLGLPNQEVRQNCFALIDRFYNPIFQRIAIDRAVDGKIADDLFWLHDSQDFPKIHPQD